MKNKKAMTEKMLVTIILLIVGFGILLYVFYKGISNTEADREVCHTSVVMRGTLPDTLDLKNIPPLKCKTRKICISDKMFGKGECDNLGGDFDTLKISKNKEKQEDEIKKIFADELADCWSMMGEGKIQVFEREILTFGDKRCVICSRINFDKNIDVNEIKGLSLYLNKKVPNKDISYWQFLTDSKVRDYSLSFGEIDKLDMTEKAIMFSEFDGSKLSDVSAQLIGGSLAVFGGFKIGAVRSIKSSGVIFAVGAIAGHFLDETIRNFFGIQDYYSSIYIVDYNADDLDKLDCDSFENIS